MAFVDPSGGVGDSFALAIAHAEGDDVVLDCVHERRAPLSPDAAVEEFVGLLRPYRVREVVGDRYSEELIRERFRAHGIGYAVTPWTKSQLYGEMLPLLTSHLQPTRSGGGRPGCSMTRASSPNSLSLERRTGGSGKDSISHPRDGHDDVANACAGGLVHVARRGQPGFSGWKPYGPSPSRAARAARDRGRGHRAGVVRVPDPRLRLAGPRARRSRGVPRVPPARARRGSAWCGGSDEDHEPVRRRALEARVRPCRNLAAATCCCSLRCWRGDWPEPLVPGDLLHGPEERRLASVPIDQSTGGDWNPVLQSFLPWS